MTTKLALNQISENIVDAKSYGAMGDGATDDTAAINAALAALSTTGGTLVISPSSGSYMIDALTSITPSSNTDIRIEKDATLEAITNASPNYAVVQLTSVDNVRIYGGGHIKGEKDTHSGISGEGGMCIRMDAATNVVVEGIQISDGWGDGIYVGADPAGQSSNITIRGNRVFDNRRNNISIVDGDSGVITGNTTYGAGTANGVGINLEPGANEDVTNWTVTNNLCYSNGVGIVAVTRFGPLISTVRNITITGNICRNNTQLGIAVGRMLGCTVSGNTCSNNTESGISVSSGSHITILPNLGVVAGITSDITVVGNNCFNNTESGIYLQATGSFANLSGVTVSGNTCGGNAENGIAIEKTTAQVCEDITITGNVSKGNTLSGLYIERANDFSITGNSFLDNGKQGIELTGSGSDTFGMLVSSNLIKGNAENGIQGWYSSKSTITGNKILANGQHGIWSFDGHSSTVTANEVSGNSQTTDATYNGIYLERSDDCVVSGNLVRHDGGSNQHKYGIEVEATAENNLVTGNNIVLSGRTANILDSSGTSTVNNNLS